MTTIACRCGKTRIEVFAPPVLRLQCCCVDCRKGIKWCHSRLGGAFFDASKPADLLYFPDALHVVAGREHLRCLVLKKGFPTRRVVSDCCWTALIGHHPFYDGKVLVSYPDHAVIRLKDGLQLRAVDNRIFTGDMDAEELAALPAFVEPPVVNGAPNDYWSAAKEESARVIDGLLAVESMDALIASLPQGVEVADPDHDGPTPSYLKSSE